MLFGLEQAMNSLLNVRSLRRSESFSLRPACPSTAKSPCGMLVWRDRSLSTSFERGLSYGLSLVTGAFSVFTLFACKQTAKENAVSLGKLFPIENRWLAISVSAGILSASYIYHTFCGELGGLMAGFVCMLFFLLLISCF